MPFTLVHTADWQIGMKHCRPTHVVQRLTESRLEAARRVVEIASEERADALVLAGDTFEDSNVPRGLVQRVVDLLRRSPCPVLVLPGNHDPLVAAGVFDHPAWNDARSNVRVLREHQPVKVGAAVIVPCPLRTKKSTGDPLAGLASHDGATDSIRIGVAHGSLIGAGVGDDVLREDFPMDRAHAARVQLDYLALGHWHRPSTHRLAGVERIAYCGTHEPTAFGEVSEDGTRRSGQCLVVTIEARGTTPQIEPRRTSVIEWRELQREVLCPADIEALRGELDGEPETSRRNVLLNLCLRGLASTSDRRALDDLRELLDQRFLHVDLDESGLRPRPEGEAWIMELPDGAPRAAAERLRDRSSSDGHESVVARRALELLYEVAHEAAS